MRQKTVILFAIVVVALLAVAYLFPSREKGAEVKTTTPAAGEPKFNYATQGELVASFPKEFILDNDARVSGSYSIGYNEGANQYTASFASKKKFDDLVKEYKNYFSGGGWSQVNETKDSAASYGLYLTKEEKDISLVILDNKEARQVTISYLVPKQKL